MKKSLVIAGIFTLMLVIGATRSMADSVAYDFETGTTQGWTIDQTSFSGANIKFLGADNSVAHTGTYALKSFFDVDEKVVPTPPTPSYVSDSIQMVFNAPTDLSGGYSSIKVWVYVPNNTVILSSNPLNVGVFMQTGPNWDYFVTNRNQRVNIGPAQEGTWIPVILDFYGCQDKDGNQDMAVTNLGEVHVVGFNLSGCGGATVGDGNTATGDLDAYIDTVTYVGASASTDITVTVQGVTLGVSVSGTVGFGNVNMGEVKVADSSLTITNTGSANAVETYSLSLVNPSVWTAVSVNAGNETYVLAGIFNMWQPQQGDYAAPEDSMLEFPKRCTSTVFAGNASGINVNPGEERYLWLMFKAPVMTSASGTQTIKVIVSAELAT